VDDDPAVRALLEIVGKRAGFTVDTSPDGLDALEKLREHDYLIMVLDLMMPRVNGYDVVQQLAVEARRPAIIVVTAMTGGYVAQLDPQVVHSIVRKPFDIDMMAAILTSVAAAVRDARDTKASAKPPPPPDLLRATC
jgi:DNA-binding response OmpR family regulator